MLHGCYPDCAAHNELTPNRLTLRQGLRRRGAPASGVGRGRQTEIADLTSEMERFSFKLISDAGAPSFTSALSACTASKVQWGPLSFMLASSKLKAYSEETAGEKVCS
jgi:hypothetical protein